MPFSITPRYFDLIHPNSLSPIELCTCIICQQVRSQQNDAIPPQYTTYNSTQSICSYNWEGVTTGQALTINVTPNGTANPSPYQIQQGIDLMNRIEFEQNIINNDRIFNSFIGEGVQNNEKINKYREDRFNVIEMKITHRIDNWGKLKHGTRKKSS